MTRLMIMALLISGAANAQNATEIRVQNWPRDVPCSSLKHKSDGTWALADIVVGPDGTRHYPNPDPQSFDNREIGKLLALRCKTPYGTYIDKDHNK